MGHNETNVKAQTPEAEQALQHWRDAVMRYVVFMQEPNPNELGDQWFIGATAIHEEVTAARQRYHELVYGRQGSSG